MSRRMRESNEMKYDVRLLEYRLQRGEIDPKDYDEFLKKLPNDENRAEYIEVYEAPPPEELTPHAEDLTFS